MNQATLQQSGKGYNVATVGNLSTFEGKAFLKEVIGTTGMEVSFGSLAPGQSVPFFHHHKQNEELYIVLSGEGIFTLYVNEINVQSFSILQISLTVSRCTQCTGSILFVYICI